MPVILRGIDRTAVIFADDDYRLFLGNLAARVKRVGSFASVRMSLKTNNVHLLIMPVTDPSPARQIQGLG